jgi:hypothetical protein
MGDVMVWVAIIGFTIVVIAFGIATALVSRPANVTDLGAVSDRWMAEHHRDA